VNEWDTLYSNLGPRGFHDVTGRVGLVKPTLPTLGFGTVMADFDLDGWMELMVANGHIDDHRAEGGDWEMKPQLFTFDGTRFHEVTDSAGEYFLKKWIGRGVATADFDDDGDLDLVVVHQNAPVALLRNDSLRGHWLKLAFVGRVSNRTAIGVRVTLMRAGEEPLIQELAGGTSYAASHQPVLIFGLGDNSGKCTLVARWPSGIEQRLEDVAVDQSLLLVEPGESSAANDK